jgi:hypothetical protein
VHLGDGLVVERGAVPEGELAFVVACQQPTRVGGPLGDKLARIRSRKTQRKSRL